MVGKTVQVMVEGQSKLAAKPAYPSAQHGVELAWEKRRAEREVAVASNEVQLIGRTGGDQIVAFDGDLSLTGQLLDVEIVDAKNMTLFGKTVEVAV